MRQVHIRRLALNRKRLDGAAFRQGFRAQIMPIVVILMALTSPPIGIAAYSSRPSITAASFAVDDISPAAANGIHCVAATPHAVAPATHASVPTAPTLCPTGQLPQPTSRVLPKGNIASLEQQSANSGNAKKPPVDNCNQSYNSTYCYASAMAFGNATSISANLTEADPHVVNTDNHSLGEIAAISADFQSIVEVGWIVYGGETQPQLFVYHWINGQTTCYDGCGWVQVSNTRVPGMNVTVSSTPQQFGIQYTNGSWWVSYQNELIGYFPGSEWNNTYTQMGQAQWFGEMSAAPGVTQPCSQMGNGVFGNKPKATSFTNILMDGTTPKLLNVVSDTAWYRGAIHGGGKYSFGGPGAC